MPESKFWIKKLPCIAQNAPPNLESSGSPQTTCFSRLGYNNPANYFCTVPNKLLSPALERCTYHQDYELLLEKRIMLTRVSQSILAILASTQEQQKVEEDSDSWGKRKKVSPLLKQMGRLILTLCCQGKAQGKERRKHPMFATWKGWFAFGWGWKEKELTSSLPSDPWDPSRDPMGSHRSPSWWDIKPPPHKQIHTTQELAQHNKVLLQN